MAMFPCSVCHRVYPGRQQTMYVHLVQGATEIGGKLRLCPADFTDVHSLFSEGAILTVVGDEPQALEETDEAECFVCKSHDVSCYVFAHAYPAKAERRSYMASVCEGCRPDIEDRLKIGP